MSTSNPQDDRDPWARGAQGEPPPVIRDKRRIDPETGALRAGAAGAAPDGGPAQGPAVGAAPAEAAAPAEPEEDLLAQIAERTADLQRLQAEYMNYRRRVERDREAVREVALINVLIELLPILDDVGRARAHDELKGGFKVVAEALEAALAKLGLVPYGESGEPFDPRLHEALMHEFSAEVSEPTCVSVLQPGYRVGERVIRAARVAVAEPEPYDPSGAAPAPEE